MTTLDRLPRITQGAGLLQKIDGAVEGLIVKGGPVLVVSDPGLRATGLIGAASNALKAAGYAVITLDDVKSDPTVAQVDAGAALARREKVAGVIAIGGGSAMDVGKSIAAVASGSESISHYVLATKPFPKRTIASVCVPTTSGTGSETTRVTVASDADGVKLWFWHDVLKPDLVVLDPVLPTGLPAALTAATGIDALVHAIEASTNTNASEMNDTYAHEAIRLVVKHLRQAVSTPGDLVARAGMQWAATCAGIAIDNAGTAVAHNIGHALASLRPVHHGRAVGLAMRATLPWNVATDEGRFAAVAELMGEGRNAARLPAAFDRLLREVGVKVSLAGEGYDHVTPQQLAEFMARPENAPMRRSNRRPIADSDLLPLAEAMLGGR